jgi:sugar (pentulose or hexulose) kinase
VGATDAAKVGMGGVYFNALGQGYVWRFPFPDDVQAQLVSKANLSGRVTNSDLEQAGLLAQVSVISHHHDVAYATLANGSDNTPAVSRITKGAVTSDGLAAHLCNYACSHQRQYRYCHLAHFLPGEANVMADDASRLQHLTNCAFLDHFQQEYPQPKPWRLLQLPHRNACS